MKKIVKYLFLKLKYKNELKFRLSSDISLNSKFEGMNKIHENAIFNGNLGYGSYIGPRSCIYANIGRFTSIGPDVKVIIGTHPYSFPFVSTSPAFYSLCMQNGSTFAKEQMFHEYKFLDNKNNSYLEIGNDCWIGDRVLIIGGVVIGDGAILLAGSVVTKDVPPYSIVGGVPAVVKKYRYDRDTIDKLLKIKWWDNDRKWFKDNYLLFSNMKKFLDLYK